MAACLQERFRILVVEGRGIGQSELGHPKYYNARSTKDCASVLNRVAKLYPQAKRYALGFSLGANIVTNTLADYPQACDAAIVVACPWNCDMSSHMMEQGLGGLLYKGALASGLNDYIDRNIEQLKPIAKSSHVDLETARKSTSVRQFDSEATCKLSNYPSVEAYYADASSHQRIEQIDVPMLCLSAKDDPVADWKGMPLDASNPNVTFVSTETGGHLGWIECSWHPLAQTWCDRAALAWLSALHDEI